MKWVNIGTVEEWDTVLQSTSDYYTTKKGVDNSISDTGTIMYNSYYQPSYVFAKAINETNEIWFSFDFYINSTRSDYGELHFGCISAGDVLPLLHFKNMRSGSITPSVETVSSKVYESTSAFNVLSTLYTSEKSAITEHKTKHNVEVHYKTGDTGRIDVWVNHKLIASYRSPSAFTGGNIKGIFLKASGYVGIGLCAWFSSIILQDTRRIGYEKFVKLNIDPDTEQNMPQGSTTNFTLTGLSDSSEYSDITSVVAVLQPTSRDANITTGTYTLDGVEVGTIDVSDSSGKAYETAHSEVNSLTGAPWTRDDIEGKTLSLTVNGAS